MTVRHALGAGPQAPAPNIRAIQADLHDTLQSPAGLRVAVDDVLLGAGRPLGEATRTDMETRPGAGFSSVHICDDSAAAASAAEMDARAYTSRKHVVTGADDGDRRALAHEPTHVIQQRVGPVAGHDNGGGRRIAEPSDRHEREAEAKARRAMAPLTTDSGAGLRRRPGAWGPGGARAWDALSTPPRTGRRVRRCPARTYPHRP
ncbi:DUF4157 domain-containing protein [Streptomyces sp. CLV115]|uniref:eCIS core domain-containing protein n=1 Tax=Streptomyces sp. CLV115 TaxID=3138502 RepID=UPI00313BC311